MIYEIKYELNGITETETIDCCSAELREIEKDLVAHGATDFKVSIVEDEVAEGGGVSQ